MRFLRTIAHLVLALAVLTATVAQARAAAGPPTSVVQHQGGHAAAVGAAHDCDGPVDAKPVHQPDTCRTACCFTPVELPLAGLEASPVAFHVVRYAAITPWLSGLVPAPDPGIPKVPA